MTVNLFSNEIERTRVIFFLSLEEKLKQSRIAMADFQIY